MTRRLKPYEVTGWYEGREAPSRPGVYQREFAPHMRYFARFDGTWWHRSAPTVEQAAAETERAPNQCHRRLADVPLAWRGVTIDAFAAEAARHLARKRFGSNL